MDWLRQVYITSQKSCLSNAASQSQCNSTCSTAGTHVSMAPISWSSSLGSLLTLSYPRPHQKSTCRIELSGRVWLLLLTHLVAPMSHIFRCAPIRKDSVRWYLFLRPSWCNMLVAAHTGFLSRYQRNKQHRLAKGVYWESTADISPHCFCEYVFADRTSWDSYGAASFTITVMNGGIRRSQRILQKFCGWIDCYRSLDVEGMDQMEAYTLDVQIISIFNLCGLSWVLKKMLCQ